MKKGEIKKPIAIVECDQEIPCNPCELACPSRAIRIGTPITKCPTFYPKRCKGCGKCIAQCPGLAIFLLDLSFSEKKALVAFPHEYLPLPVKGQEVSAIDQKGAVVGRGRVVKVDSKASNDQTPVIYVAVPKKIARKIRGIAR